MLFPSNPVCFEARDLNKKKEVVDRGLLNNISLLGSYRTPVYTIDRPTINSETVADTEGRVEQQAQRYHNRKPRIGLQ